MAKEAMAFPGSGSANDGMQLRDYLAAKAMQGILANHHMIDNVTRDSAIWVAREAYQIADAMIAARGQ